ncbi:MAG: efflux RND transporter permease subunit [Lachnospiraceae bacterium]|nr:efflux RND transporter permease subunit [Lachnospiraceae bacterium]
MHRLTKGVLNRPVTVVISLLAMIVFSATSLMTITLQLTPDISVPVMLVNAVYPGADPIEADKLVASVIEEAVSTVTGVKATQCQSQENYGVVALQFDYGTDMDKAYDEVKKAVESVKSRLPEDCQEPVIMEIDMSAAPDMTISVVGVSEGVDVLNEIQQNVEPELKKISALAQTTTSGGDERYISVELIPEYASQYGLDVTSVTSAINAVNFSMPTGSAYQGDLRLTLSAETSFETIDELNQVPITTRSGQIIHLSDIANVHYALSDKTTLSRYDGIQNVTLNLKRKQSSTSVELSRQVNRALDQIRANNPNLDFHIVYDAADIIIDSLKSVGWTLLEGIGLSMFVLLIFFGDFKASLIVGSSMPISLLITFILISAMGFSLNIVTLSSMVIGIGMMVDNAIVVIEMCFRKRDEGLSFRDSAYLGAKVVMNSIIGSTITTVVVYFPLAVMKGLSGQLFKQLGFTIIFAIVSSLFSAITIIPFFFAYYKPVEKKDIITNRILEKVNRRYGKILSRILDRKKLAAFVAFVIFGVTIYLATMVDSELLASTDEGAAEISLSFRPNLSLDAMNQTVVEIEEFVKNSGLADSYTTTVNQTGASASVTGYKSEDTDLSTKEIVDLWNQQLTGFSPACDITVRASSTTGFGSLSTGASTEIDLTSTDMDDLKAASSDMQAVIKAIPNVLNVTSSLTETGSRAKVVIDPVMATAHGFSAQQLAMMVYRNMTGQKAMDVTIDTNEYAVTVEYPKDRFHDVSDVETMTFISPSGAGVPITEMAHVTFSSSPQTIFRQDGQYYASITAYMPSSVAPETIKLIHEGADSMTLPASVRQVQDTLNEMMDDEFTAIIQATIIAVFLVFMVMAIQFESVVYSLLIMLCIPFALSGSILLLLVTGVKFSMTSLMGILMLSGIVVNNGIIFIDTANQYRFEGMEAKTALIEAGKSRLRPILMTTLTTILSMIPLSGGFSENAEIMRGMGIVIIGGLIASTILTLILLPTFYMIVDKLRHKKKQPKGGPNTPGGGTDPSDADASSEAVPDSMPVPLEGMPDPDDGFGPSDADPPEGMPGFDGAGI